MSSTLTRKEMLARMFSCDAASNGLFITGVLTTGIYCLPSCPARKPKAVNVTFFFSVDAAQAAGLRACKRCRPDEFYAGIDRDQALAQEITQLLAAEPTAMKSVAMLADKLNVSVGRLYALVQAQLQTTPGELISRYKIAHAQHLLRCSSLGIAQVGFESGFESMSTFYFWFKRCAGTTPAAYRMQQVAPR